MLTVQNATCPPAILLLWLSLVAPALGQSPRSNGVPVIARANLEPMGGSTASGLIEFAKHSKGHLIVEAQMRGAKPGSHGIHIHEGKSCKAPGSHFNPTNTLHGSPNTPASHLGDLGNILTVLDGTGVMRIILWSKNAPKRGGWDAIVGRTVVIHRNRDNLRSQPDGNSGPAISCGVIEKVLAVGD